MAYDDVIQHIGENGRRQWKLYFLLCLPAMCCAFHEMGGKFLTARTDFRCLLSTENIENATFLPSSDAMNIAHHLRFDLETWPRCEKYEFDFPDHYNTSSLNRSEMISTEPCDTFVYDKTQYTNTATIEWNLVCERAWIRVLSDSLFMGVSVVGGLVFGQSSDRYGRKVTFIVALVIQLVSGILVAIAPEIISYTIFRCIVGSTASGVFLVSYVMALEMVGPADRMAAATGCHLFYSSGYLLISGIAYGIRDWRFLQIAFTIPSVAFLGYWWCIPESIRWLLSRGRKTEAENLLQKTLLRKGAKFSDSTLEHLLNQENERMQKDAESSSMFDLLRYPNLRRKTLLLSIGWFVNNLAYYGLSWSTSELGGDDYVNCAFSALVEMPAQAFAYFTVNKWGRKIVLCGSMIVFGTALLLTSCVPEDMPWMVTVLAMFGKMTITSSYVTVSIFAAEQLPTQIRNLAMAVCSTAGNLGGVVAPYVNDLGGVWTPLPLIIFGSCSLCASLLMLLLPETLKKKLPESIREGENFGSIEPDGEAMMTLDLTSNGLQVTQSSK